MVEKIIPTETLIEIQSEINEELEQRKQSSESNQRVTVDSAEFRTDTERIDQLREMLYRGSIEVSDGLGLRRGWTDLRCALDNIL